MTDKWGKTILGENGMPIITREYYFKNNKGKIIVIQDHSGGHTFPGGVGNQGPHINVRPIHNTRTGPVPDTRAHYTFADYLN